MAAYHLYFLIVHITAGMISLVVAPIAFLTLKGGRAHRLWGKVYFYCMAVVAVTAITMSLYHNIPFLLMIAVFSFSAAARGYRTLYRKKPLQSNFPDYLIDGLNALFCAGLCYYSFTLFQTGEQSFAIISGAFGIFGLQGSIRQLIRLRKKEIDKKAWLYEHIGNMSGSYIASVTAFLVTALSFLPPVVAWLGPSLIGAPLIFYTIRKYKKGGKVEALQVKS
ncbi:MAG: DUF2306 domain-containing protein [Bacteroidota bacterium]|nr:DUF2306 domain-containing protein [Bacteroidota bacterium]